MNRIIQFGEEVEGYSFPVLNEREIRAAAGILFLILVISILEAGLKGNFLLIKYAITIFLTDISIRVLVSPRFAPFLIIGRLIVRNQVAEYVGAPQKKFAWIIGMFLSGTIFVLLVVMNARSPITGLGCLICLIFLFFETAFGMCLGCKFYSMFYREKARYCPGEVCNAGARQAIQKTSRAQMLVVLGFIVFVILLAYAFNGNFSKVPYEMFRVEASGQAK
jgi:hypothetical protein